MTPRTVTRTLSTAEERRITLVEAAMPVFAEHGFRSASTVDIASAAGISQAYLFRLFPTKVDLFIAVVEAARKRMLETFRDAASHASSEQTTLEAMGEAYRDLLEDDRDLLQIQLQSQVVSGEPRISAAMQQTFRELYAIVAERSGAGEEELRSFFAAGMLKNVMAAIDALELDEPWAQTLCGQTDR